MKMLNYLSSLFRKLNPKVRNNNSDVVQPVESKYCAVINNEPSYYDSKDSMLKAIETYSKVNVVFSLSMFRYDIYNLLK